MNKALAQPLEFNHGNFRFTMSTTLERLEERLDSDFFRELFGAVLVVLGILGEYLGKIIMILNREPQYIIREKTFTEEGIAE